MFFYSDTGPRSEFDSSIINKLNPNTQYIKHLENLYYLKFIEIKSDKFFEKAQAKKEIEICLRKMQFWKRKINNEDFIKTKTQELKNIWGIALETK